MAKKQSKYGFCEVCGAVLTKYHLESSRGTGRKKMCSFACADKWADLRIKDGHRGER